MRVLAFDRLQTWIIFNEKQITVSVYYVTNELFNRVAELTLTIVDLFFHKRAYVSISGHVVRISFEVFHL